MEIEALRSGGIVALTEFLTEGLLPHRSHCLCHNATQTVYPENPDCIHSIHKIETGCLMALGVGFEDRIKEVLV